MTAIEWTDETWNPTTGCDRISPGCDHCYALTMAGRLKLMGSDKYQNDGDPRTSGPGFGLTVHPDALDLPLKVKKPTRWFVNSMSDLFHQDVPDTFIFDVLAVMVLTPQHTYQLLTKRPQRMARLFSDEATPGRVARAVDRLTVRREIQQMGPVRQVNIKSYPDTQVRNIERGDQWAERVDWPIRSLWAGTSIENDRYTFRADHLRAAPAAVRFLSLEPLLGPLPSLNPDGIDWVIVGGESGPGARPMHPDWARDIRDRCQEADVPYFFKQWGSWLPYEIDAQPPFWNGQNGEMVDGHFLPWDMGEAEPTHGWVADAFDPVVWHKVGKKKAGRLLDGRTWDECPGG